MARKSDETNLEILIREKAGLSIDEARGYKCVDNREADLIFNAFKKINKIDRPKLGETCLVYSKLKRDNPQALPVSGFLKEYVLLYERLKSGEARKNLQDVALGVVNVANVAEGARRALSSCTFNYRSSRFIGKWIESLVHLENKVEGSGDGRSKRLERYLGVTNSNMKDIEPHISLLEFFKNGSSVYGAEPLLFDLTAGEGFPVGEVEDIFRVFERTRYQERKRIEHVRLKVMCERAEINRALYELLRAGDKNERLQEACMSFLVRLVDARSGDVSKDIFKGITLLNDIVHVDGRILVKSLKHGDKIAGLGDDVNEYLGVVRRVSELEKKRPKDVVHYLKLIGENFRDYDYMRGRKKKGIVSGETVARRSIASIDGLDGLPEELRDSSLSLIRRCLRYASRYERLENYRPYYTDSLIDDVRRSVESNVEKAPAFLGTVFGFSFLERGKK